MILMLLLVTKFLVHSLTRILSVVLWHDIFYAVAKEDLKRWEVHKAQLTVNNRLLQQEDERLRVKLFR
jgi:hypothetical protein